MRIKIDSLGTIHGMLKRPSSDKDETDEPWRLRKRPKKRSSPFGLQYHPAPLLYPLEDITAMFKKWGNLYSANVVIDARDKSAYRVDQLALAQKFEEAGYKFVSCCDPTIPSSYMSTGYLLKNGDCSFSITAANEDFLRVISIGTHGAHTRGFPKDAINFIKEVGTLEALVNIFLDCLYARFSERDDVKAMKDKVLYLNP